MTLPLVDYGSAPITGKGASRRTGSLRRLRRSGGPVRGRRSRPSGDRRCRAAGASAALGPAAVLRVPSRPSPCRGSPRPPSSVPTAAQAAHGRSRCGAAATAKRGTRRRFGSAGWRAARRRSSRVTTLSSTTPPCARARTVPTSALPPRRHVPRSMSASTPANAASPPRLPNAPSGTVPSRVRRSPSQPARRPNTDSGARHASAAPVAGACPDMPSVVSAMAVRSAATGMVATRLLFRESEVAGIGYRGGPGCREMQGGPGAASRRLQSRMRSVLSPGPAGAAKESCWKLMEPRRQGRARPGSSKGRRSCTRRARRARRRPRSHARPSAVAKASPKARPSCRLVSLSAAPGPLTWEATAITGSPTGEVAVPRSMSPRP